MSKNKEISTCTLEEKNTAKEKTTNFAQGILRVHFYIYIYIFFICLRNVYPDLRGITVSILEQSTGMLSKETTQQQPTNRHETKLNQVYISMDTKRPSHL